MSSEISESDYDASDCRQQRYIAADDDTQQEHNPPQASSLPSPQASDLPSPQASDLQPPTGADEDTQQEHNPPQPTSLPLVKPTGLPPPPAARQPRELISVRGLRTNARFAPAYYHIAASGPVSIAHGISPAAGARALTRRRDEEAWSASVAECKQAVLEKLRITDNEPLSEDEREDVVAHGLAPPRSLLLHAPRLQRAIELYAQLRLHADDLLRAVEAMVYGATFSANVGVVHLSRRHERSGSYARVLFGYVDMPSTVAQRDEPADDDVDSESSDERRRGDARRSGSRQHSRRFVLRITDTTDVCIAPYTSSRLVISEFTHVLHAAWSAIDGGELQVDPPFALNLTPSPTLEWLPFGPQRALQVLEYHATYVRARTDVPMSTGALRAHDAYDALAIGADIVTRSLGADSDGNVDDECDRLAVNILRSQIHALRDFHASTSFCHNDTAARNFLIASPPDSTNVIRLRVTDFDLARHATRHPLIRSGDQLCTRRVSGPDFRYFLLDYVTMLWCVLEEHTHLAEQSASAPRACRVANPARVFATFRTRLGDALRSAARGWLRATNETKVALQCVTADPTIFRSSDRNDKIVHYGPRILLLQHHVQQLNDDAAFDIFTEHLATHNLYSV